jgi:hypothetical protein
MIKPRNCRCGCGQTIPDGNTLRKAATIECAMKLAKAATAKKERKAATEARIKTRADKARIKPLTTLCKEARRLVQKWCRLRDERYGVCICCGVARIDDGAHFHPVGSKYRTARISLNPDQIHGACSACNRFVGGGNMLGYIAGLAERYGPEKLLELTELKRRADSGEDAPLTKEEVTATKAHYSKLIRQLEANRQ